MRQKVLEIGCGFGFFTWWLSKKNQATGIDFSAGNIETAKQRYPGVDFRVGDAENLGFPDDSFDKVYALDILEHVDNFDKVIKEVQRVLKNGGKFVANIPYYKSEEWLLKIRPTYFAEIHHVRIFADKELEEKLLPIGLTLLQKKRKGFLTHLEYYLMFKRKINHQAQTGIGNWRDNWKTKVLHISVLFFSVDILKTPFKYCPIWLITLPLGLFVDLIGNHYLPKSQFYIFRKNK